MENALKPKAGCRAAWMDVGIPLLRKHRWRERAMVGSTGSRMSVISWWFSFSSSCLPVLEILLHLTWVVCITKCVFKIQCAKTLSIAFLSWISMVYNCVIKFKAIVFRVILRLTPSGKSGSSEFREGEVPILLTVTSSLQVNFGGLKWDFDYKLRKGIPFPGC